MNSSMKAAGLFTLNVWMRMCPKTPEGVSTLRARKTVGMEEATDCPAAARRLDSFRSVLAAAATAFGANNMRFAREINPDVLEIFYVYPFPGSKLHQLAVEEGLLEDGVIPREAYGEPCMPTKTLSVEQLKTMRRRALRDFTFRPMYILRTLSHTRSPREFLNYVKVGSIQAWDLITGNKS